MHPSTFDRRCPSLLVPQLAAALVLLFAALACSAAGYPDRPIRLVMGFPPGSTVDILARPVAQRLTEAFGQPVIVDNRSGATGIIANEMVARAQPDGYTLLAAPSSSLTSTPHLAAKLSYDALRDFVAVAQLSAFGYVLVVNPGVPAKNLRELMALANSRPEGLTYGSSGTGSGFHLAGELFQRLGKVRLLHVPYKGGPPGVTDLMAGRIDFMFYSLAVIHPQIRAGKLRVLAVTASQRDPLLPDVPTMAESGLKGYEAYVWMGMLAPRGTPVPIIARLNREMNASLKTESVRTFMNNAAIEQIGSTPAEFGAFFRAERDLWARIIREVGAKIE